MIFGGFKFWNLYGSVCMFVFYEMMQMCNVICAQIHAHVSVMRLVERFMASLFVEEAQN